VSAARTHLGSGKVRELYTLDGDRLLLVASDRISTYDVVLPTEIPDKGRVLTGLSAFWFSRLRHVVPNHARALHPDGRSLECERLEMLPVEIVVRGYLAGSAWVDYLATGAVCGHGLEPGLREAERLPEPIVTPATKSTTGHDLNITEAEAAALCAAGSYQVARAAALALYREAHEHAEARGVLVADTKFEFGIDADGVVTLGDEALTPDSSRLWPAPEYAPGGPQPSFDKQYVRDWCLQTGWDRTPPGPELPPEVVDETRSRYTEAFELLTGIDFERYLAEPEVALCT
jgi:phosphoribosylaminoimidazole-succinocarboxamide synthase